MARYASSRKPEDLVEEFEIDKVTEKHLDADYNVAPTKDIYAVLERPLETRRPRRRPSVG